MEDESHDSKLAKVEEIVEAVKPTLLDCTVTQQDPAAKTAEAQPRRAPQKL